MSWSIDNELLLRDIGIECQVLYLAHSRAYNTYHRYGHYFLIPSIIISSVVGSLSFNQSFTAIETNQYILGALNLFVASLGSIYKILNYNILETEHFNLSRMFYLLYDLIRIQLQKAPDERRNYIELMKEIEDSRNSLFEKNTIFNNDIIKTYKSKYKGKIDLPLSLNQIQNIKIYGHKTDNTCISSTERSLDSIDV